MPMPSACSACPGLRRDRRRALGLHPESWQASVIGDCVGAGFTLATKDADWIAVRGSGPRRALQHFIPRRECAAQRGANFRYSQQQDALQGLVLFFDAHWNLLPFEKGWLGKILPDRKAPPPAVSSIDQSDPR